MSIEKKSLISTLKTTKKANVASNSNPAPLAPEASHVTNRRPKMSVTNRRPKMSVTNRRPKRPRA